MRCPICEDEFLLVSSMTVSTIKKDNEILRCRIRCPKCSKVFDYEGDPKAEKIEEGRLANMRSTIKPAVKGKRSFPKDLKALAQHQLSQEWYDYCGPHITNAQWQVDYLENLAKERYLNEDEFKEYLFWKELLDGFLLKKAIAEKALREKGDLDDTV